MMRAGTPIAVACAGTSLMTNELDPIVAQSPMRTGPSTQLWHPSIT
jgi:hypothetical protein